MGILDFESQRERRTEMLRDAESKRVAGSRRSEDRKKAGGISKLAGLLTIGR